VLGAGKRPALGAQRLAQQGLFVGWWWRWRYPHVPFWTVAPDLSNRWG
jgi:hypothetical protein